MKTLRPCLAEFIGTFYLCFAGIAAILSTTPAVGANSGLVGIALAGACVAALIYEHVLLRPSRG